MPVVARTRPRSEGALRRALVRSLARTLRFGRGLQAHNAFEAAAAIAFWAFLSLVPLLVLAGFLVGRFARARGVDALVGPLLDVVPGAADGLVRSEVQRLAGGDAATLAPLGLAGYFWTASSGLHNLMDVFETAAKVKRRAWWKQRAIALAWVGLGLAATCVLACTLVKLDATVRSHEPQNGQVALLAHVAHGADHPALRPHSGAPVTSTLPSPAPTGRVHRALHTPVEQAIAAVAMLAVGMAFLAGFYRFAVQHPPRVKRRVWPGTVVAVGCWLVVSWGFGAYAVSIADYALYYGSLATVAVLLVWLYLSSLSLVIGAEVNAELEGIRAAR